MENEEILKCWHCNKDLTVDQVVLCSNRFAYCKCCKKPICDWGIQDENHFLKRNYDKIEKKTYEEMFFEGYSI